VGLNIMKARPAWILGLCLGGSALAGSVEASEQPFWSGRVYFDAYAPLRDPNHSDFRELVSSIWLTGAPKLAESSSASFTLQAEARESGVTLGIREATVSWAKGNLDLRVGRQIVSWGKSDAVNPTDFLSAKNYTVFNPDEEVRRTGTELIQFSWVPARSSGGSSPWVLTAVYAPKPARSRLLIADSTVPTGVTLVNGSSVPATGLDEGELGVKASYSQSSWDLEVLAFRGWNHLPDLQLVGTSLTQTHHHESGLGINASASSGRFVFRAESAWIWTENPDGLNPLVEPTHWDSVLGVERSMGEDFRIQLQMISRVHPDFLKPEDVFTSPVDPRLALAKANALVQGYQFKTRIGATFRAAYTSASTGFEAELFALGNFMGGDSLLRPRLSYPLTDSLRLTGGMEWYSGPRDRSLGALQDFNSVFAEAKASF